MSATPLRKSLGSNAKHLTPAGGAENCMNSPNLLGLANDDEAEKKKLRRKSSGRRKSFGRKSLGGKAGSPFGKGGEEYFQQLADMCSTVIKLSSENKINQKNAWEFNLIDSLSDVCVGGAEKAHALQQQELQANTSQRENQRETDGIDTINFQRASCTLDASVKIYSYRVDDTHTSSFKVLENLSRNRATQKVDELDAGCGDEQEHDDDSERGRTKRKRASRGGETIADVAAITAKDVEQKCEEDPLFHKMSLTFDEGGAKGMLLHNLCMFEGCNLAFDSDLPVTFADVEDNEEEEESGNDKQDEAEDITAKEKKQEQEEPDFLPPAAMAQMLQKVAKGGHVDWSHQHLCPLLGHLYKHQEQWGGNQHESCEDNDDEDYDDEYDNEGEGMDMGVDEDEEARRKDQQLEAALECAAGAGADDDDGMTMDFDGLHDGFDNQQGGQRGEGAGAAPMVGGLDAPDMAGAGSEYAFAPALLQQVHGFGQGHTAHNGGDVVMVGAGAGLKGGFAFSARGWARGGWAGADHWKFPSASAGSRKGRSALQASKPKAKKTAKSDMIDFSGECIDEKAFAPPPRSAASTQLSNLSITRNVNGAAKLLLPIDLHYELPMLTKLFLKPSLRVRLSHGGLSVNSGGGVDGLSTDLAAGTMVPVGMGADVEDTGVFFGGNDFGGDDDDDDDDGMGMDEYGMGGESNAMTYGGTGLVEAARTVAKIDIKYDRVSKKVDVKKLKASMWQEVQTKVKPGAMKEESEEGQEEVVEEAEKSEDGGETTFSGTISEVSSRVPANVTVPFYFICLLHLANEKGLALEGSPELSDFIVRDEPGHIQGC